METTTRSEQMREDCRFRGSDCWCELMFHEPKDLKRMCPICIDYEPSVETVMRVNYEIYPLCDLTRKERREINRIIRKQRKEKRNENAHRSSVL